MDTSALTALSPLDGRYYQKVDPLRAIFSEFGLIKFRVIVEIAWLKKLIQLPELINKSSISIETEQFLQQLTTNFSLADAASIKKIEAKIKHDVKAVEYFIKERIMDQRELATLCEFIHFGCTSEDINNLAYGLMLKTAREECILPELNKILATLKQFAHQYANLAMLARTHGQPATPTTIGKELANVIARLTRQKDQLINLPILGKLNGATGNYNALVIACPEIDWQQVSRNFIADLGLQFNSHTTQIEPHDNMAEYFAILVRINNILLDLNRDVWGYIAIKYFKQKSFADEIGSSTMPHKINPIDFENAEGNLGLANALLEHMISKLPISRWQRDLSDSTVLRNIGSAVGYILLAYQSTDIGLKKLEPNLESIEKDLDDHSEVLAEAIQTVMRRYKIDQSYEQLKTFTRGKPVTLSLLHTFISQLNIPIEAKNRLLTLEPKDYIGYAEDLAKKI